MPVLFVLEAVVVQRFVDCLWAAASLAFRTDFAARTRFVPLDAALVIAGRRFVWDIVWKHKT